MSTQYQDLAFTSFPNSINNFVQMLNMVASDGALVTAYQQAMQQGNTALAQSYYNQITNANQKFVDATKLNTLMDTCVALQRFYLTDIQPYITTKQADWQGIIDQFSYKGIYNPATQYEANNFVLYTTQGVNLLYLCTATPPNSGIAPNNTSYWRVLTIRGAQGDSGATLSFLYDWSSTTNYSVQDCVIYNNALWGSLQSNINQPPVEGSVYWQKVFTLNQVIYPFQSYAPSSATTGELWFQTL